MAQFKWMNGNQGVWTYSDFRDYDVVRMTDEKMVWKLARPDEEQEGIQPTRIVFELADAEMYTNSHGTTMYVAGSIKTAKWLNEDGDVVLKATDLGVDVAPISAMVARSDYGNVWNYLSVGGNEFIGSNNSRSPDGWDGDDFNTGSGDDIIRARGGDDFITDHGGSDFYDGGDGVDVVTYASTFWEPEVGISGIKVDLEAGYAIGPDGLTDTLVSIENIRGTFASDEMLGNEEDNRFAGMQGRDVLDGRGGFDTAQYDKDANRGGYDGVKVNLEKGFAIDGFGTRDKLISIEAVRGTNEDDLIVDDGNDNYIDGRGGNDRIVITEGDDWIRAGGGNDIIVFKGENFGHNIVQDFEDGATRFKITGADSFDDLTIESADDTGDAVISFGNGSIELQYWSVDALSAEDFIF